MNLKELNIKELPLSPLPLVIAGPCSAESREQMINSAVEIKKAGVEIFRAGVWKPRTKPGGFEGVGMRGLRWLKEVKEVTGMRTATEVAKASHVRAALKYGVDILWIGARTTANPFAVQEIADTLAQELKRESSYREITILIKNPINPDPELWIGAIERILHAGIINIGAIHRGFGTYEKGLLRNTPHWNIPIELKRRVPTLTILCDPSHIGGRRELIYPISQSAYDMGFDGLMIESHITPESALSDSEQQITPQELAKLLAKLSIRDKIESKEALEDLRREIDEVDERILELISKRMTISREIGRYKIENNISVLQPMRYDRILNRRILQAGELSIDKEFIKNILESIHKESVRQQLEVFKEHSTDRNFNKKQNTKNNQL